MEEVLKPVKNQEWNCVDVVCGRVFQFFRAGF